MLERIRAVPVSKQDLADIIEARREQSTGTCDKAPEGHVGIMLAVRVAGGDPNLAFALFSRLSALTQLIASEGGLGWTLRSREGAVFAESLVVAAAAAHPLVLDGDAWVFDRDSFLARLMALSDAETGASRLA